MKDQAPHSLENAEFQEALLETIVSAHYLALQMLMLKTMDGFPGTAETELMAEALSRWARLAGARWRGGAAAPPSAVEWSSGRRDGAASKGARAAKASRTRKLESARR